MIIPRYRIQASAVAGAGKGLFLAQAMPAGSIITTPDAIEKTYSYEQLTASPALSGQLHASARWFENRYTVSPDWPDECFLNHSFSPNGLWHLGFVFALFDLPVGTEITVDYRHLLAPGQVEDFIDATTGAKIVGWTWAKSLTLSTLALSRLLETAADLTSGNGTDPND